MVVGHHTRAAWATPINSPEALEPVGHQGPGSGRSRLCSCGPDNAGSRGCLAVLDDCINFQRRITAKTFVSGAMKARVDTAQIIVRHFGLPFLLSILARAPEF